MRLAWAQLHRETLAGWYVATRKWVEANPKQAAAFVRCARSFASTLEIITPAGDTCAAQSITGVLTANLNQGATFRLRATGPDAEKALTALADLVATFHDDP